VPTIGGGWDKNGAKVQEEKEKKRAGKRIASALFTRSTRSKRKREA
jgi:hypothetical protein